MPAVPVGHWSFVSGSPSLSGGRWSVVNDDASDNRFYEPVGRFPTIEEDVSPFRLLVNDYERYYQA